MNIDFTQLLATLGGISALIAAISVVLGKAIEKSFEHKLKVLEDRQKLQLEALHKRTLAVFEKQITPLKTIVALTYRARNTAREIIQHAIRSNGAFPRDSYGRLRAYHEALEEMLNEERAMLPSEQFAVLHEMKISIRQFLTTFESYIEVRDHDMRGRLSLKTLYLEDDDKGTEEYQASSQRLAHALKGLQTSYESLDRLYQFVITKVQEFLGLEEAAADGSREIAA